VDVGGIATGHRLLLDRQDLDAAGGWSTPAVRWSIA
jgi:hypothetical protein